MLNSGIQCLRFASSHGLGPLGLRCPGLHKPGGIQRPQTNQLHFIGTLSLRNSCAASNLIEANKPTAYINLGHSALSNFALLPELTYMYIAFLCLHVEAVSSMKLLLRRSINCSRDSPRMIDLSLISSSEAPYSLSNSITLFCWNEKKVRPGVHSNLQKAATTFCTEPRSKPSAVRTSKL